MNNDELLPISTTIRLLLQHWWLLVLATVLGAAVGFALVGGGVVDATARATVGLSDNAEWPNQLRIRTQEAEQARAAAAATEYDGVTAISIVESGDDPSRIFVDVAAGSSSRAADVANEIAGEMVQMSDQLTLASLASEVAPLEDRLGALDIDIAALRTEFAASLDAERTARADDDVVGIRAAERETQLVFEAIRDLEQELRLVQRDLDDIQTDLASPQAMLLPVADARSVQVEGRSRGTGAALGALAALTLAVIAVPLLRSTQQKVQQRGQLAHLGLDVIDIAADPADGLAVVEAAVGRRGLDDASVAVVSVDASTDADMLAEAIDATPLGLVTERTVSSTGLHDHVVLSLRHGTTLQRIEAAVRSIDDVGGSIGLVVMTPADGLA